jgi:hypothetical protein
MSKCLPDSSITNRIFGIFLQVMLIFVFLTLFFFTYVGAVEKDAFKLQMNIVVDDLSDDMNVRQFVAPGQEDTATVIMDGSLEVARRHAMSETKKEDKKINDQNATIRNKALKFIAIAGGLLVVVVIILVSTGHCVPFHLHTKEALIVVFFVALTEILFLNIITKKYWSVNPSDVRHQLGESMKGWIKENHPQSSN